MWRIVLVVALAVGLAATASGTAAQAGGGTLTIGSGAAAVGQTAYVNVMASDVPAPGTGTYAIRIHFDPNIIEMTTCTVDHNSVCEQPDDRTTYIAAASTDSFAGDWVIAGITFRCVGSGVSPFTIDISVWGSAIPETVTPQPAIENGAITCVAPTPTALPTATALPASAALPPSGGGHGQQPITPWWPVALVSIGAGAVAFGAVWMRRRR